MRAFRFTAVFRVISRFSATFAVCGALCSCTIERAEETILATHANGAKKTSIWVYPNGEILKRNEWYSDGIKEYEIPYKDNEPDGEFKRWTGYGDLVLEGEYKKGLRHGKWISYYGGHFNKKKEAIRYYKEDHPVGDWEGWHFNGEKAFEEHYNENGDSVGVWKKWDENRTLVEENSCFESNEKGHFKKFAKSCKILESYECNSGEREGSYKLYYETFDAPDSTGESCNISKIRESGVIVYGALIPDTLYRADGSVIKTIKYGGGHYKRSLDQWFDEQGKLIRESFYTEQNHNGYTGVSYGLCEGSSNFFCAETSHVREFSPSGSMDSSALSQKEAFRQSVGKYKASIRYIKPDHKLLYEEFWDYVPDKSFGDPRIQESRSFYPDSMGGKMASEGFWKFDLNKGSQRNGIWRNWYPSGILKDSLTYVNGERVGEQFSYDSTGKLTIHKTENGKNRPVIMHILGSER
ncbi:toxin-antitoxin system YwqK family antitoxin [Fibrobacter sp. HC4]|uniref:toxin-antitoxin system YwqK family antitoxin n=1 Tax=Fibrobacter sp. HC4 TaxID=3239812 RepID=UPI002018FC88|nr:hypothetical protein [Fibrobacter succinogenes]MCL4100626.1 hypothetical protein [Fibrobacter succinogenes]